MKDNLDIDKLFKDKFESFEPTVNPKVWQNVAGAMGSGAASTSTGLAVWLKGVIIGGVAASTISVGAWMYFNDNDATIEKETVKSKPLNSVLVDVNGTESSTDLKLQSEDLAQNINSDLMVGIDHIDEEKPELTVEITEKTPLESVNDMTETNHNQSVDDNDNKSLPAHIEGKDEVTDNSDQGVVVKQDANIDTPTSEKTEELVEDVNLVDSEPSLDKLEDNLPIEPMVEIEEESFIKVIPNVITPNEDGVNDQFFIEAENIEEFYIMIYSQFNVKLFESTQADFRWDGYDMKGQKVPKGTYYYLIKAIGEDKEPYSLPGQLTIR